MAGHLGVWTAPNILDLDRWQIVYRIRDEQTWGSMVMSVRNNSELRVYVGLNGLDHSDPALRDPQVQKQLIAERYAHMGWEVPRLLTYMWEAPDFHFDSGAQIHMDSCSTGRVVLLGDAGYCGSPASGQGSSMATARRAAEVKTPCRPSWTTTSTPSSTTSSSPTTENKAPPRGDRASGVAGGRAAVGVEDEERGVCRRPPAPGRESSLVQDREMSAIEAAAHTRPAP